MIEAASKSMSMKGEAVLLDRTGTLAKEKQNETVVYREIIEIGGVAA